MPGDCGRALGDEAEAPREGDMEIGIGGGAREDNGEGSNGAAGVVAAARGAGEPETTTGAGAPLPGGGDTTGDATRGGEEPGGGDAAGAAEGGTELTGATV